MKSSMKTLILLATLFITCLFASVTQAHGNHSDKSIIHVSQPSEVNPMKKQTLLFAMATAIIAAVPQDDLNGIALTTFDQAGKVMSENLDGKRATVKQIEDFNPEIINIKMSGAEIVLAHNRLVAIEPADIDLADKAIADYSAELIVKASDEAERIKLAEKAKQEEAANKLALKTEKDNSGTSGDTGNEGEDEEHFKEYALSTPVKFNGKLCKTSVKCSAADADVLKADGLIANSVDA